MRKSEGCFLGFTRAFIKAGNSQDEVRGGKGAREDART